MSEFLSKTENFQGLNIKVSLGKGFWFANSST